MDTPERERIVRELRTAFGSAKDVSPDASQPLHVLLGRVRLPPPWTPCPARALARFHGWPSQRPDLFVDSNVVNASGEPPYSNSEQYVLGETWRQFSFQFGWPAGDGSAASAVQLWLTRFKESR